MHSPGKTGVDEGQEGGTQGTGAGENQPQTQSFLVARHEDSLFYGHSFSFEKPLFTAETCTDLALKINTGYQPSLKLEL